MKKTLALAVTALSMVVAALFLYQGKNTTPSTGALTLPSDKETSALIPLPQQKPMLEVGEKTKLFMNNDAYLFGKQADPSSAALSYRVGVGKEIESAPGHRWTGEVSIVAGVDNEQSWREGAQTRLSAAYLRQLNDNANFRAGLSTDLATHQNWSTLELQLSMELADGFSLKLNHGLGKNLKGDVNDRQTDFELEKKF